MTRLALLLVAATACSGQSAPSPPAPGPAVGAPELDAGIVAVEPAPVEDVVLILDPAALAVIDEGAGFAARLPGWQSIADVLAADVRAAKRADPKAGVGVKGNAHRLFDARWLERGRFELVGVANRIDRTPLGGCGDVRLTYRLAYTIETGGVTESSRLPMTVNVVYGVDDDGAGCRDAAARWRPPAGLDEVARARWLVGEDGALAPARLDAARLVAVQVNLQLVRWPSAVRPDLGGHAEYLLRAFRYDGAGFAAAPLDNVPDVAKLREDEALRAELLAWITDAENLARIDDGVFQVPARFLADRAISVAPRGLSRRANRPFRQLFTPGDLGELALDGMRTVRSAEAVLRRLDDATCQGCHQSRTIAGFHLLGIDPPEAFAANALAVPVSPHVIDERARRAAVLAAIAAGDVPDWRRPFAERAADGDGGWGSRCGLGDAGFAGWTCAGGLRCDAHDAPADDRAVGVCVPERPEVGDPCEPWPVTPHADPHKDRIRKGKPRDCGDALYCNATRVGFPGGMCTADCDALPTEGACGAIAILTPFNNCLARREPFERCLEDNVAPAGLRACDEARPCREDYICVRAGDRLGDGACIPPYFLFQLRVDGHPTP